MGRSWCSWNGIMSLFPFYIFLEMAVVMVCAAVNSTEQAKLSAPRNIYMNSTNMKHYLYWDPILNDEGTVNFSVRVQGEYERSYMYKVWTSADGCQSITARWCNVTDEIATNVWYELQVRAELGSQKSDWATIGQPFNRNSSVLTPPAVKFQSSEPPLTLEIEYLGPNFVFIVFYWKKGNEDKVVSKKMYRGATMFHLENVEGGNEYCAQVIAHAVPISRNSSKSTEVCATAKRSGLSPLTTGLISLFGIIVGLALLCVLLRNLVLVMRYSCYPQRKIPDTLKEPFSSQKIMRHHFLEDCEKITSIEPSNQIIYKIIGQDCSAKTQLL
ncbi:interleukin-20 receptor subunit beta [Xenopus laevis]|uniref:Interleukin-20 receptor subunit beta n=2 Tax=Xenopus laevis TaxID=8355 RepID=A0A1L8GBB3_XENLA|nr:interleukin-20 receptor subunit beta [Xenopus laevis]OCT81158.1 hypothetical protein XELAEV_18027971mg [Xenopus laevis]